MTQKDNKGFLLLHLSVFIAGFTGVLGRLIELDSAVLVWHRMAWAAVLMALFLLFRKELQRYSLKDIAQMGGGLVVLTAIFPIYNHFLPVDKLFLSGLDYPYMAFMVVVCTIGLCLLQIIVLQKIDAFTVNLTYNLEPVYSIIIAMIIFNEYQELNFSFILGIALIIISVVLQTWSKLKVKS